MSALVTPRPFPSDAPLVSEITMAPDGRLLLGRRLDEPWRQDRHARQLFLAEIEAASRIPSDSIFLASLVAAEESPEPSLQREFSSIGTLGDRIRGRRTFTGAKLLTIAAGMLAALDEIERLGLVHGDPSPSNLLLTPRGDVQLADFLSSRAAFAGGFQVPGAEARRQRDRRSFVTWFSLLVSRLGAADDVGRSLREILGPGGLEELRFMRFRRFIESNIAGREPLDTVEDAPDAEPPAPLEPLPVSVVIGPATDERSVYLSAKYVAGLSGAPVSDVRRRIQAGTESIGARYPGEARALADRLAAFGISTRIVPRAASQEP